MNWPVSALGDVCRVLRGTTITQNQTRYGSIPVVAGGITPTYYHDTANRQGNIITVSASGANAGFVNFWDNPIFASDCSTVESTSPDIAVKYVYHFLRSKQEYICSKLRSGAAQPHVYAKDIAKLYLPVPPISEQRRIAAILDQVDALRAKRRDALAQLDSLAQSIFIEMFGDPATNPLGWSRVCFGSLFVNGPQNGLYKPASDYGSGTPILRIDSFYNGRVTGMERLKRVRVSDNERNTFGLRDGDIVINRVNSPEYLGKSALIPPLTESTVFESNMMRISIDSYQAEPRYIVQFLQSEFIKSQIRSASKDAVNQSSINQQDVKSFLLNLPPLAKQKEFVSRLSIVEELKAKYLATSTELDNLFASLQHRAFRGGL